MIVNRGGYVWRGRFGKVWCRKVAWGMEKKRETQDFKLSCKLELIFFYCSSDNEGFHEFVVTLNLFPILFLKLLIYFYYYYSEYTNTTKTTVATATTTIITTNN